MIRELGVQAKETATVVAMVVVAVVVTVVAVVAPTLVVVVLTLVAADSAVEMEALVVEVLVAMEGAACTRSIEEHYHHDKI